MSWLPITSEDVRSFLGDPLADAFASQLSAGFGDPSFAPAISASVSYLRSRISGRVPLSLAPDLIPSELKDTLCALVMQRLSTLVASVLPLTKSQESQIAQAYKDLLLAGTVDFPIAPAPDAGPLGKSSNAAAELGNTALARQFTKRSIRGL